MNINVSNQKCIQNISYKSLRASKARNAIAIIAIALTTILFTALFTIALSIKYGFEQSNFRMVGGYSHAGFKYVNEQQIDELSLDPLIKEWGVRRFLGLSQEAPLNKIQAEVSYCDKNEAKWMFLEPVKGSLPKENTNEAATDTRVLSLLGIEPELGREFTLTINVGQVKTTQTFTLCGWWEYDELNPASHILIPASRVEEILSETKPDISGQMTGSYGLDVMFKSSAHIEKDILDIAKRHGYQTTDSGKDDYIAIGVNWGYAGSQLYENMDPATVVSIVAALLLILFTGYLIIYNIFQISVSNDMRFYGLLKTIGFTGRQLKKVIFIQAISLSAVGIPIGMLTGYGIGAALTPVVISNLNGIADSLSISPWIFIGSAIFSLITVVISCLKPGKMAAKASPIEAVRYTDVFTNEKPTKKRFKHTSGASIYKMAYANLRRNRKKTFVTIISLSLAIVILTVSVIFVRGFDMDKYISSESKSDFMFADAVYFHPTNTLWGSDNAIEPNVIDMLNEQGYITNGGRTYSGAYNVSERISTDALRHIYEIFGVLSYADDYINSSETEDDMIWNNIELYGMEKFCLDKLGVIEGDISKLYGSGNYIAAVAFTDDYNKTDPNLFRQVGDKITFRYSHKNEYYNPLTGEVYGPDYVIGPDTPFRIRPVEYTDKEYEIAAIVTLPHVLSERHYGMQNSYIMNGKTFIKDTGMDSVMYYAFDVKDGTDTDMEKYISSLTNNTLTRYDYESKQTIIDEFNSFVRMFWLLGSVLSFIIGLIGVLNFMNAHLTSIVSREHEFAILQAVGMSGRQLKKMLITEGEILTLGSVAFSLIVIILTSRVFCRVLESMFWFFTYKFTLLPFMIVTPLFAVIGALLPIICYRFSVKKSIVDRIREA